MLMFVKKIYIKVYINVNDQEKWAKKSFINVDKCIFFGIIIYVAMEECPSGLRSQS